MGLALCRPRDSPDVLKANGENIAAAQLQLDNLIGTKRVATEEEFAKQGRQKVESVVAGSLNSAMHGDIKGILDSWGQLLEQMAAEAIAKDLTKALFGSGGSGGRGLLGLLGGLITGGGGSSGGSGVVSGGNSFKLPPLATGTNYVQRDMVAMLHQSEAVVPEKCNPAAGGAGAGGGLNITQVFHVGQGEQRAEMVQVGRMAKEAAVAEIQRQVQRGNRMWDH